MQQEREYTCWAEGVPKWVKIQRGSCGGCMGGAESWGGGG